MSRMMRHVGADTGSQVRDTKTPPKIERILCLGMGDGTATVMASYLAKKAMDDLQIGKIRVESAGLAKCRGKPAEKHTVTSLRSFDIDCTDHVSRCVDEVDPLTSFDVILCTDLVSFTHTKPLVDESVRVIHIEGLSSFSDLSGVSQGDHNSAAQHINKFVRALLRSHSDALAE